MSAADTVLCLWVYMPGGDVMALDEGCHHWPQAFRLPLWRRKGTRTPVHGDHLATWTDVGTMYAMAPARWPPPPQSPQGPGAGAVGGTKS